MSNSTYTCPEDTSTCTFATCAPQCAQVEYRPTVAGNLAYLIIFAVILVAQLGLGWWHRTWGFLVGMFCGLILEIIGYVGRIMLHTNPFDFNAFLIYLIPLTIAPVFLTAAIYLCLSRIIVVYGESLSRLSPRVLSIMFVVSDVISLILQAAGGAISATSDDHATSQQGIDIMIAGLAWQVLSLVIFMAIWADFIWRCHKAPEDRKSQELRELRTSSKRFMWFQYALWLATITIFIRSVYRVVELSGGFNGAVANNEPLFMVLEGPMIIIAVAALTVLHPGYAFAGCWSKAVWSLRRGSRGKKFPAEPGYESLPLRP